MCSSRAIKEPALPLRRSSRLSLERYAHLHSAMTTSARGVAAEKAVVLGEDIEDAVTAAVQPRKRRRIGGDLKTGHIPLPSAADNAETDKVGEAPPKGDGRGRGRARKPDGRIVIADATTREPDMATAPPNWEEMYQVLRRMRAPGGAASNAAVDTMGCERLADPEASPRDRRFHTLIALMLSSQTKDTVNAVVMRRLKTELPAWREAEPVGLNVENVLAVSPEMLNEMIWPVGFHNNKTKYIKQAAEILRDRWGSDIPDSVEGLMSLPGVGPKMAYLCMSAAWDRTEGIGVDVHVHRITNLWGWNGPARLTASPEATRLALQAWLPRDRWREINGLLVGLGQTVCLPVGRKCGDCDLGLRGLCRAAERGKVAQGRIRAERRAAEVGGHTGEGEQSEEA